jgi:hypothetical protein
MWIRSGNRPVEAEGPFGEMQGGAGQYIVGSKAQNTGILISDWHRMAQIIFLDIPQSSSIFLTASGSKPLKMQHFSKIWADL